MASDPFASPMISQILAWMVAAFLLIGILWWGLAILVEKKEGMPKLFEIWLLLCVIVFSPLRYILLQALIATIYPFQSLSTKRDANHPV